MPSLLPWRDFGRRNIDVAYRFFGSSFSFLLRCGGSRFRDGATGGSRGKRGDTIEQLSRYAQFLPASFSLPCRRDASLGAGTSR